MNAKQFFDLTVKVRKAQKDYFAARKRRGYNAASKEELQSLLDISRNLERALDAEIERVCKITSEPQLNFG
jgi:hypothetical protein